MTLNLGHSKGNALKVGHRKKSIDLSCSPLVRTNYLQVFFGAFQRDDTQFYWPTGSQVDFRQAPPFTMTCSSFGT